MKRLLAVVREDGWLALLLAAILAVGVAANWAATR